MGRVTPPHSLAILGYNTLFLDLDCGARCGRGHDHGADHPADVHNLPEGVQGPGRQGGRRCVAVPAMAGTATSTVVSISTVLILAFVLLPMYWMLATSFKTTANIGASPPQFFPHPISGSNLPGRVWRLHLRPLHHQLRGGRAVRYVPRAPPGGTLAGYALARFPIRGKFPLMVSLLIISVFPEIAVIAPLYLLMRDLGWLNSYQALIVPYTAFFFTVRHMDPPELFSGDTICNGGERPDRRRRAAPDLVDGYIAAGDTRALYGRGIYVYGVLE